MKWFVEVFLVDTGQPVMASACRHGPLRAAYFSEDIDPVYPTRQAAQRVADQLNAANARFWVQYGVGEICLVSQ